MALRLVWTYQLARAERAPLIVLPGVPPLIAAGALVSIAVRSSHHHR